VERSATNATSERPCDRPCVEAIRSGAEGSRNRREGAMRGDGGAVSERGQIPRERTNDGDERRRRQSPTTTPSTGASRTDVRGANERSYDPVGRLPAPGAKRRGLRARGARSSPRTSVECQSPAQRDRRERMRRGSSGITRLGNASPRPQVSDARRVLRRFPPACCRTSDETPRNSATEESEVRRMDDDRAERASLGAPNRPRVRPLCGARCETSVERTTRAQCPKSFVSRLTCPRESSTTHRPGAKRRD